MEDSLKPIVVNHEWGVLKEAVVGYPHFRVGRRVAFWFKSYYTQEAVEMQENWIRNFSGRTIAEFDPDLHHEQVQQVDAAIKILQDRGIIVHQVKPMQPDEEKFLENFESDSIQSARSHPGRRQHRHRDATLCSVSAQGAVCHSPHDWKADFREQCARGLRARAPPAK